MTSPFFSKRARREAADATKVEQHREGATEKVDKAEEGAPGLARTLIRMDLGDSTSLRSRAIEKEKADSAARDEAVMRKLRK